MKTLEALIDTQDPGWPLIEEWMAEAKNRYRILPKTSQRADRELLDAQVTTRSIMGAVIYETGGILINEGWIRVWDQALRNSTEVSCHGIKVKVSKIW